MTIPDKAVEAAARAAYAKIKEHAPKYYSDRETLDRYVPWEELSDRYREDCLSVARAALAAAEQCGHFRRAQAALAQPAKSGAKEMTWRSAGDILRVLGDPRVGVHVGPDGTYTTGPAQREQSAASDEGAARDLEAETQWCSCEKCRQFNRDTFKRAIAQARAEGMVKGWDDAKERCARIARDGCLVPPDGGLPTEAERLMCEGIAATIREAKP